MLYHSTRCNTLTADSAQAVLEGLAPDGGLYLPEKIPAFDWKACLSGSSQDMSAMILSALLPDIPEMKALVHRAYTGKFETEDLTPLIPVGDFSVLELFRGPTSAFKDVALSMLPQLLTAAKTEKGVKEDILILTATSGDTGKAALEGFRDVPGVRICVFYPDGGVSQVQRAQMVTQEGKNVYVCAVKGNFDDAQTGVKNIFAACQGKDLPYRLSSANSINIGRLAPQVMYYFRSYRDLLDAGKITLGQEVNFSVPTGNFGDILAGYLAKLLGLPVGMLVCASNANNVLTDFLRTGTYDRNRTFYNTMSPSMDILISSNLERLLLAVTQEDSEVRGYMEQLKETGRYEVSERVRDKIQRLFAGYCCDDAETQKIIGAIYRKFDYLIDPHTAVGFSALGQYRQETGDETPTVVASTASPFKFCDNVLSALGVTEQAGGLDVLDQLSQVTGEPVPAPLAALRSKQPRFHETVEKDHMVDAVLEMLT